MTFQEHPSAPPFISSTARQLQNHSALSTSAPASHEKRGWNLVNGWCRDRGLGEPAALTGVLGILSHEPRLPMRSAIRRTWLRNLTSDMRAFFVMRTDDTGEVQVTPAFARLQPQQPARAS